MKEQIKNHILNALLWVPPELDAILRDGWVDIDGPRTFCLMEARAQMYMDLGYSSKLGVG